MTWATHLTPDELAARIARDKETDGEKDTRDAVHAALTAAWEELDALALRESEIKQHIGDLMRLANQHNKRNPEPWLKVEVTKAADLTGLSRPTLYALRDRPHAQWRPEFRWPGEWHPDWMLARGARVYEDQQEKLHRRYPHLAGLYNTREFVTGKYLDELEAAGTPWDMWGDFPVLPPHLEEQCAEADKAYWDAVRDIARGPLGAATPSWWDADAAEAALRSPDAGPA